MARKTLRKHARHVDKKLKFRLKIFIIVATVMFGVVLYDIFTNILPLEFAMPVILVGLVVGIISARMYHLSWSHDAQKIVSRLDSVGIVILIFYLIFAVFRGKLIEFFVQGPVVGAVSFSVITGIMIGRVLGTRGAILKTLEEEGLI